MKLVLITKSGWKIKPTAELAYVFAGGDRELSVRQTNFSGGGTGRSTQLLSDRDNFRASIGLDAKKKNVTVGLGVNTLLSSSQKDIGVNATVRVDLESGRRFGRGASEKSERELRREQNQNLVADDDHTDFVVSSNMSSLFLAQLAESPELAGVFGEILSNHGNELYLKNAGTLFCTGEHTVAELRLTALRQKYIMLGYMKDGESVFNPGLHETVYLGLDDSVIVLGEN